MAVNRRTLAAGPASTGVAGVAARLGAWGKRTGFWYLFIAPNILTFIVFHLLTWVFLAYISFTAWDVLGAKAFVGLDNYAKMVSDHLVRIALSNTIKYVLLEVLPLAALSLTVAILVNRRQRGSGVFRTAFFLPVVTSIAVLGLVARNMLGPTAESPLNYLLGQVGVSPHKWLLDVDLAMPAVAGIGIWAGFGYYMILWLAGLQSIPLEYHEAARIDGASDWGIFWRITLPLLGNTTAFILIIATIGALQVFGSIYILTGGGPVHATTTFVWYIYTNAFSLYRMGYAAALSVLLFVIILSVTLLQQRVLKVSQELY